MEGAAMFRLAEAVKSAGFAIKKIEEIAYGSFDRPSSGEKYTGELALRLRPAEDAERVRVRRGKERAGNKPPAPEPVELEPVEAGEVQF